MKEVTVTESILASLLQRPDVQQEFPEFKAALTPVRNPRGGCCRGRRKQRPQLKNLKYSLISMPANKVAVLKRILGADTLVVFLPAKAGPTKHVI